jgi:hypothetical protein
MLTPDSAGAGDVDIFQLQADHTWRDTGVAVDSRANATGDALPDGDRLYVVSRESASDVRVARFAYDDAAGTYRASGTPATIATKKTESATIAKDTQGRLWVTFTNGKRVWVMHTATGNETSWTAPFTPQVSDVAIDSDDISAVVALPGAVGVMWSDQASSAFASRCTATATPTPRGGWRP